MAGEYWDRYWRDRKSRRGFLGGAAAISAGAAGLALVGCGDDDDDDDTGGGLATPTPGANASPTASDPFANAKKGGTYKADASGSPPSIDPLASGSFLAKGFGAYFYSRLMKYNAGPGITKANLKPVGDAAATVETSPDGLVWTFKLRPNLKFHNLAPVNGRAVTGEDVKYSIDRATDAKNTASSFLSGIEKHEYPDQSTVKITLKAPNAAFLDVMADTNALYILPKESGSGGFDAAKQAIGSGPWVFDGYTPDVSFKAKRNPEWYMSGFPLMDGVEVAIIPEAANRIAQFQSGNTDITGIPAELLVDIKKNLPKVQFYGEVSQLLSFFFFSTKDPNAPWMKDERVRLAMSMALDRDGLTDLGYNVKKLRDAGLDVKDPWNNIIPAGMERFWLDPKGPNAGDSGQYFKYNVAEAKKLMSAAGFANGFEAKYQYTANRYGATFNTIAETNIQFLQAIGIKCNTEVQDYSSTYFTQTFAGNFEGIAFGYETPFPEGGAYPNRQFGTDTLKHSQWDDAKLRDIGVKQQQELDPAKRKELFWEYQRYQASKMYYIPNQAGAGTGWEGHQEWMQNVNIQTVPGSYGAPTEEVPFRWKNNV